MHDDCEGNEYVVITDAKECFCDVKRDVDVEVDVVEVEEDDVEVGVGDDAKMSFQMSMLKMIKYLWLKAQPSTTASSRTSCEQIIKKVIANIVARKTQKESFDNFCHIAYIILAVRSPSSPTMCSTTCLASTLSLFASS